MTDQIPEPTKEQLEWFEKWAEYWAMHYQLPATDNHARNMGSAIMVAAHYKRRLAEKQAECDALRKRIEESPVAWWCKDCGAVNHKKVPGCPRPDPVHLVPDPVETKEEP